MKKVFLGGTCNDSIWRDDLIKELEIDYFNPVVKDWTPECMEEEIRQREVCDFVLYTITPKMTGVYSIAEVVDDSNKRPYKTLFCVLDEDKGMIFSGRQKRSIDQVASMIRMNGGKTFTDLHSVAEYLNKKKSEDTMLSYEDLINMHGKYVKAIFFHKEPIGNPVRLKVKVSDGYLGKFIHLNSDDKKVSIGFPNGDTINKGTWVNIYKLREGENLE